MPVRELPIHGEKNIYKWPIPNTEQHTSYTMPVSMDNVSHFETKQLLEYASEGITHRCIKEHLYVTDMDTTINSSIY